MVLKWYKGCKWRDESWKPRKVFQAIHNVHDVQSAQCRESLTQNMDTFERR